MPPERRVSQLLSCSTPTGVRPAARRRPSSTLYVADYDTEKALKKALGVTKQSTIVVFKGGKEAVRSTGDTNEESLAKLLRQALT
jgi:hypothetical protein